MHRYSLVVLSLAAKSLLAQGITGSIVGTVVDPSDTAIPESSLTLTQLATGAERQGETDERGDFVFGSLQPGEYSLRVETAGFKRFEKQSINLPAAERLFVGKLVLELGEVSESVTVEAQGATVQTASAERSGVITSSQVDQIAIRGRNVMSLLQLLPGVVFDSDSEQINRGWALNINGNRRATTSVSLDGMASNAIGNNNNMLMMVSQDAVAEVKVLLTNFQAEHGRMSGANVHLITKSGTKEFHGGLSYYKRHEQFNANDFFNNRLGLPKARYRFNTHNYNIGGPVYVPGKFNTEREKLFFFWSQEFWPLKTPNPVKRHTLPTELERTADFSQSIGVNGELIQVRDPLDDSRPFPDNIVPASRIDRNGQALLNVFPSPNFFDRNISGGQYNFVFQDEANTPKRTSTLKIDYQINQNNSFSANFTEHADITKGSRVPGGGSLQWGLLYNEFHNIGKSIITSYRRVISPSLVNELRVGLIRRPAEHKNYEDSLPGVQRDSVGFDVGQFNSSANPLNLIPDASFGGVPNFAPLDIEGRFPLVTTQDTLNINNNLTKILNSHTIKAGFYLDHFWRNASSGAAVFNGAFDFGRDVNNPLDTSYAYSNALTGVFRSYRETTARPFAHYRLGNVEWFVQDQWKATRRLTLDLGVRFQLVKPIIERDDLVAGFVPSRFDLARQVQLIQPATVGGTRVGIHPVTGEVFPRNLIGAIAPGTGDPSNGMVAAANEPSFPRGLVESRGIQFGPRVGFALDVFGTGNTAIRGGVGVFYNRQTLGTQLNNHPFQPPLVQNPVVNFGTLDSFLSGSGILAPQNVLGIDTSGKIPTVYNYSFSVQQNIGFGTVFDIAYVGNLGRHLMWQRNLNVIPTGANFDPANADPTTNRPLQGQFLVPFLGYNNINFREWGSSSNYHSLQVTANRRFARGLQFGVAWTWSKSMDYNSGETNTVSSLVPVRIWNYGLSSFDRTHIVRVNWLWDIPKAPFTNRVLDRIVNHWKLSGIASLVSGQPLGITLATTQAVDITGTPSQGARVVMTGDPILPKAQRSFDRFFNTDVFQLPETGTFGNAARTVIRGPGINNFDIALFKDIPVSEGMKLQFRCEFYNAFNHTQFSHLNTQGRFNPATGAQVSQRFGAVTGARPSRRIQLALRFLF